MLRVLNCLSINAFKALSAVICIAISVQFGGKIKALFETADSEIDTVDSGL